MERTARAIVVAAGSATRMQGFDKIFGELHRKPIIAHTLLAFENAQSIESVTLVIPEGRFNDFHSICIAYGLSKTSTIVAGGPSRQRSVSIGLAYTEDSEYIAVHDGARPCITPELIERGIEAARITGVAAIGMPVTDTLKMVESEGGRVYAEMTTERERFYTVQTPQVFLAEILRSLHRSAKFEATDDASLAERAGFRVLVYPGSADNIKITTMEDLKRAGRILAERDLEGMRAQELRASG